MTLAILVLCSSLSSMAGRGVTPKCWPPLPPGCPSGTFVENRGQWPGAVDFLARVEGAWGRIEGAAILLQIDAASERPAQLVRLSFEGGDSNLQGWGAEQREGHYVFFLGADPVGWHAGVPGYSSVRMEGLYDGIDVVVRERKGRLKYDLLLEAGSDPSIVRVRIDGADFVDPGELSVADHERLLHVPGASWEVRPDGSRVPVTCTWSRTESGALRLSAPLWTRECPLVIDPELEWSTYLGSAYAGGTGDGATGAANDPTGNVVIHGGTEALELPTTLGTYQSPPAAGLILFAAKLRRSDGGLVYSNLFAG